MSHDTLTRSADYPAVAVLWANFGPYHLSRAAALKAVSEVSAIELAPRQDLYGWSTDRDLLPIKLFTLGRRSFEEENLWYLTFALWRKLNRLQPAFVLIPGYTHLPFIGSALWAKFNGSTAILMSESTYGDYRRSSLRERLKGAIVRALFAGAIVGGKRSRMYVQMLGLDPELIEDKYDVVDNDYYASGVAAIRAQNRRQEYNLPRSYILFVGRLASEKNLEFLLSCFATYRRQGGTWDLVIVGAGPLEQLLRIGADALNIARHVVFAGFRERLELLPYYAFAECFVLPSTREPWGLVVNEAMACGLPVLVSENCGSAEDLVTPGKNGFIFSPTVLDQLSTLLLNMEALDPSQRRAMGEMSYLKICDYTPRHFAESVQRLFQNLPKRGRSHIEAFQSAGQCDR